MNYALHKFHVKQQYVSYRVVGKSMKTLRMLSVVKVTNYVGNHRWAVIFLASDAQAHKMKGSSKKFAHV